MGMRYRGELSDQEWERLQPHLPPERPEKGRPNVEHRRIINGILWRERTGAPWRDLPERYGPWSTVYSRFWRWREAAGIGSSRPFNRKETMLGRWTGASRSWTAR